MPSSTPDSASNSSSKDPSAENFVIISLAPFESEGAAEGPTYQNFTSDVVRDATQSILPPTKRLIAFSPSVTTQMSPPPHGRTPSNVVAASQLNTSKPKEPSVFSSRALHLPSTEPRFLQPASHREPFRDRFRTSQRAGFPSLEHRPVTDRRCCSKKLTEPGRIVAPLSSLFGKRLGRLDDRHPTRFALEARRRQDYKRLRIVKRRGRVLDERRSRARGAGHGRQRGSKGKGQGRETAARPDGFTMTTDRTNRLNSPLLTRQQGFGYKTHMSPRFVEAHTMTPQSARSPQTPLQRLHQSSADTHPQRSEPMSTPLSPPSSTHAGSRAREEESAQEQRPSQRAAPLRWPGAAAGYIQSVHWIRSVLPLFFGSEATARGQTTTNSGR